MFIVSPETEAVVTFEYGKQQEDEIDLKVGDIIQDVKQVRPVPHHP